MAYHYLNFICKINRVFLQDAAAMIALHPAWAENPIFHELRIFHNQQWGHMLPV